MKKPVGASIPMSSRIEDLIAYYRDQTLLGRNLIRVEVARRLFLCAYKSGVLNSQSGSRSLDELPFHQRERWLEVADRLISFTD